MKRLTSLLTVLLLLLALTGCSHNRPRTVEFTVLVSSDISNIVDYDLKTDQKIVKGMANFATLVKEESEIMGRAHCIVLDEGNKFYGGPISYYYSYVDQESEPLSFRANRQVGYDLITLGNRDAKREGIIDTLLNHPEYYNNIVCANLVRIDNLEPIFQPYQILHRNGINIAVLGMMPPQELTWEDRYRYEIIDMIECAQRWMPEIQSHHPDLVIGLFSCGVDYEAYGRDMESYKNPDGGIPTGYFVPGFDLILMRDVPRAVNSTFVNAEGQTVHYMALSTRDCNAGKVHIRMIKEDGHYRKEIETQPINLADYPADPDFNEAFVTEKQKLYEWINTPVGYLGDTLYQSDGMFGPSRCTELFHRAQMFDGQADLSITSCLLGVDTFMPGPITMKRIFEIYPFENEVDHIQMSGEEIQRALEWIADRQYSQKNKDPEYPHVLYFKHDKSGHLILDDQGIPYMKHAVNSYCQIGGIRYVIDLSKPSGQRVTILSMADGKEFSQTRFYTVAMNSYLARDGYFFITEGLRWDMEKLSMRLQNATHISERSALHQYFLSLQGDTLHLPVKSDWYLAPTSYTRPLIEKEKRMPLRLYK